MDLFLVGLFVMPVLIFLVKCFQNNMEENGYVKFLIWCFIMMVVHSMISKCVAMLHLTGWIVNAAYISAYLEGSLFFSHVFGGPEVWEMDDRHVAGIGLDCELGLARPNMPVVLSNFFRDVRAQGHLDAPRPLDATWPEFFWWAAKLGGLPPVPKPEDDGSKANFWLNLFGTVAWAFCGGGRVLFFLLRNAFGIPAILLIYVFGRACIKMGLLDFRAIAEVDPSQCPYVYTAVIIGLLIFPYLFRSMSSLAASQFWRMPVYAQFFVWVFILGTLLFGIKDLATLNTVVRVLGGLWFLACGVFLCVIFGPFIAATGDRMGAFYQALARAEAHGRFNTALRSSLFLVGACMFINPAPYAAHFHQTGALLREWHELDIQKEIKAQQEKAAATSHKSGKTKKRGNKTNSKPLAYGVPRKEAGWAQK